MLTTFTCRDCGKDFTVKNEILARYDGWQPSVCLSCKNKKTKTSGIGAKKRSARRPPGKSLEENLQLAKVLERYTEGPHDGVFTDGACLGNPGPGGWGAVWVRDNQVVDQRHGHSEDTTNNRMELEALVAGYEMLPADASETIWSDSKLCVQTINEWAAGWQKRGWQRKTGPVQNLELVKRAFALSKSRPGVKLRWIKAHNGSRWNEYADSLATAFQRDEL